jgi:hypothetical protein
LLLASCFRPSFFLPDKKKRQRQRPSFFLCYWLDGRWPGSCSCAYKPHFRRDKRHLGINKNKATCLPTYRFFEILENIFIVFLSSSCREAVQNTTKKLKEKNGRKKGFSLNFFGKKFLSWIFPKKFLSCF